MLLKAFLAHQLGRPSGIGALFIWRTLNRVNARANALALERLALQPSDHFLDLGFGGGLLLREALPRLTSGLAAGVDISEPMLARARRRFRDEIAARRLEIREGSASSIPYAGATFDKAATINTLHFWPNAGAGLRELRRVLKPGGRLVLAVRPKDFLERVAFTRHGFAAFEEADLARLLLDAGFGDVAVERHADADMGIVLAQATRPHSA